MDFFFFLLFWGVVVGAGILFFITMWLAVEPWVIQLGSARRALSQMFSSFSASFMEALWEEGTITTPEGEIKTFTIGGIITCVLGSLLILALGWALFVLGAGIF